VVIQKDNVIFSFESCKQCGEERTNEEHKECVIIYRNCKDDNISIDFRCPVVAHKRSRREKDVLSEYIKQLFHKR
jgi:hypothetical protein